MKSITTGLVPRLAMTAVVVAVLVGLGMGWPQLARWALIAVAVFVPWAVIRDAYLSAVHVSISAERVTMAVGRSAKKSLAWSKLVFHQVLDPNPAALFGLWASASSPAPFGTRSKVPLGFEWRNQLRRLVTMSPDLLLIDEDGRSLLIPLDATLNGGRVELLTAAGDHAPGSQKQVDAIREASECEAAAQARMLGRLWADAIPLYERAVGHWQLGGRTDQCSRALQNLATCLVHAGQYTAAAGALQRALVLCKNLRDLRAEAHTRSLLSGVEWSLGGESNLRAALRHLHDARRLFEVIKEEDPADGFFEARMVSNQALCQERLAGLYRDQDPAAAEAAVTACERFAIEALDLLRNLRGVPAEDLSAQRANLNGTLARCAFMRQDWTAAVDRFEKAAAMSQERIVLPDRAMWGRAEFLKSRTSGVDPLQARRLVHEALERVDEAVRSSPFSGSHDETMEIVTARGDIYWDRGRWDEAARDYEFVLRLIEQRPFTFSRPSDRAALRRRFRTLYPRLVEANLRLAAAHPEAPDEFIAWAFQASERFKATSLAEMLSSSASLTSLSEQTRRELEEAQLAQRRAIVAAEGLRQASGDEDRGEVWRTLWDAEERLKQASAAALAEVPTLEELSRRNVPAIDDVLAALPDERTAVLQFSICEGGLAVFVICRRLPVAQSAVWIPGFRWRGVPSMPADSTVPPWIFGLPGLLRAVREEIFFAPTTRGTLAQTLERLEVSRVAIIPEGTVSRLPLHCGVPAGVRATYAPSCAVLLRTVTKAIGRPSDLFVVDYPHPNDPVPLALHEGAIVESCAVAAGLAVKRLSGPNATPDAVMEGMRGASWFHFAGHGESDDHSPWLSYLYLAEDLTATTLLEQHAVREGAVAVINGCSTGVAPGDEAGEFVGLPAAFLALGYSVVLSTLWDMPAGSPLVLMDRFYDHLLSRHEPVIDALSAAAEELRVLGNADMTAYELAHGLDDGSLVVEDDDRLVPSHPWHWAGHVVWGALWSPEEAVSAPSRPYVERTARAPLVLPTEQGAPPEVMDLLQQAKRHYENKDLEQVRTITEQCMRLWGRNRFLVSSMGEALTLLGEAEQALPYDEEALQMDLNSPRNHYSLGCGYMDLGRIAEARSCFRAALDRDPGYWKAHCNLGTLTNDPREVLFHLREAARLCPEDEDTRKGIEQWERIAADREFDAASHRIFWATKELKERRWRGVRWQLALARELPLTAEQRVLALGTEAEMLREQGRLSESIACMEASLGIDDTPPSMWNTLSARYYLLAMDTRTPAAEAKDFLRRSVDAGMRATRAGDYSRPHRNLALAYQGLGQWDDARREARIAAEIAEQQIANGPQGTLLCQGCPSRARDPNECRECLGAARSVATDVDLAEGTYRV